MQNRELRRLARKRNLAIRVRQSNPTGKSLPITGKACQAPKSKIFRFSRNANRAISTPIPSRSEGRIMIVTNVGRVAVDAEVPITNGTDAYGEVVWS